MTSRFNKKSRALMPFKQRSNLRTTSKFMCTRSCLAFILLCSHMSAYDGPCSKCSLNHLPYHLGAQIPHQERAPWNIYSTLGLVKLYSLYAALILLSRCGGCRLLPGCLLCFDMPVVCSPSSVLCNVPSRRQLWLDCNKIMLRLSPSHVAEESRMQEQPDVEFQCPLRIH